MFTKSNWAVLIIIFISLSVRMTWCQEQLAPTLGQITDTTRRSNNDIDHFLDSTMNPSCKVFDIITGTEYTFQVENQLMILERNGISIDTFVTGSIDHYTPDFKEYYQTFITYQAVSRGSATSGETYIFCIASGHIELTAVYCSYTGYCEDYETKARVGKSGKNAGYELLITEDVHPGGPCPSEYQYKVKPYKRTYKLKFDSTSRFFYSNSVTLDNIPAQNGSRTFKGAYPAIVLRQSTTIRDGKCWRWVGSHHDNRHYIKHPKQKDEYVTDCEGK